MPPQTGPASASPLGSGSGDQLVAYFESGDDRATFVGVRNGGPAAVTVEVTAYDEQLVPTLLTVEEIPAHGRTVLDLAAFQAATDAPTRGILLVSGVDALGRPIVTGGLSGTVTIADLEAGSAWGTTAIARRAVELSGAVTKVPTSGAPIDGTRVFLEQVRPSTLHLPSYYAVEGSAGDSPASLAFLSFADVGGGSTLIVPRETEWIPEVRTGDGSLIATTPLRVQGVRSLAIDELAGESARTVGGSIRFDVGTVEGPNRIVFFHQSLAGFGIGFTLAPSEAVP